MSSSGGHLAILGMGNGKPIVMDVHDGKVKKFYTVEHKSGNPTYRTYGAIYNDVNDHYNQNYRYTYISFLRDDNLEVIRL